MALTGGALKNVPINLTLVCISLRLQMQQDITSLAQRTKLFSTKISCAKPSEKSIILRAIHQALIEEKDEILMQNQLDMKVLSWPRKKNFECHFIYFQSFSFHSLILFMDGIDLVSLFL